MERHLIATWLILMTLACKKEDPLAEHPLCTVSSEMSIMSGWRLEKVTSNYVATSFEFTFLDRNLGYAVAAGNQLLVTINGGADWSPIEIPNPGNASVKALHANSHETISLVLEHFEEDLPGAVRHLLYSTDAGKTWETKEVRGYYLAELHFLGGGIGYAFAFDTIRFDVNLIRTFDHGDSWSQVDEVPPSQLYADLRLMWKNDQVGLVQTGLAGAYYTINGGAAWHRLQAPSAGGTDVQLATYYMASESEFLATTEGLTWHSNDGGTTWQPSRPDGFLVLTVAGNTGIGVLPGGLCLTDPSRGHAFVSLLGSGANWLVGELQPRFSLVDRQEVAPGLFVAYDTNDFSFYWIASN